MLNESKEQSFDYFLEQFADLKVLRYQVPGFEQLSLQQQELIYCLSEAARWGRDIIFDQNYKYNLAIRHTIDCVYRTYSGDRQTADWKDFEVYAKRVWFSNGIHHHYSTDKFFPSCKRTAFEAFVAQSDKALLALPAGRETLVLSNLLDVIYDPEIAPKRVSQDSDKDMVQHSACHFYTGVTEQEAVNYYAQQIQPNPDQPLSLGLNTRLVKEQGQLRELVWKLGGEYSAAIEKIVFWLQKALQYTENSAQRATLEKLIAYYETGDLATWDAYNIMWINEVDALVDTVNGFIEVYGDPLGMKGTWEAVVNFKDVEATRRTELMSAHAQWFEDHSPVDERFKKAQVRGVSAKVITVAQLGGDCYPTTPIGINLPNADWLRAAHGSKSVTIENITYAYDQASLNTGFLEAFAASNQVVELSRKYGFLAGNLHTDLHECLGHGSGQMLPGVKVEALKNYHSPIEEARADLFALYYMMDEKMVEWGLMPSLDVAKTEYNSYIMNGLLTQMVRIEPGKDIEQAHMRNRQLIASWCYEQGHKNGVIEKFVRAGKTFFRINDYKELRALFARLLAEVQRIKSEGDYAAAKQLVEQYGVKLDKSLHQEVLMRYKALNIAPYSGFVNPEFIREEQNGVPAQISVAYPTRYAEQMVGYGIHYSALPLRWPDGEARSL